MSGTHSTSLLVADGLAQRGWEVGMLTLNGAQLTDTPVKNFDDLATASSWLGNNRAIWCYHGDAGIMEKLQNASIRPVIWCHIDLSPPISAWLDQDWIEGIVTVSDFCRLALLHHSKHCRIGRIYNPLNPFFSSEDQARPFETISSRQAVFSGYVGESKGVHHLFQCWRDVRRTLPEAHLVIAGSAKLYRNDAAVGPFGVADPEFERRHIVPLEKEFGSLDAAGVRLAGLLSPDELRSLYLQSSLGIINLNARSATETFSCSGVEMAACGLRVISMAAAALPETVGFAGNASLLTHPDQIVPAMVDALGGPRKPANIESQQSQIRDRYALSRILDNWEQLLVAPSDGFFDLAGPWQYSRDFKYFFKKMLAQAHAGKLLDRALALRQCS